MKKSKVFYSIILISLILLCFFIFFKEKKVDIFNQEKLISSKKLNEEIYEQRNYNNGKENKISNLSPEFLLNESYKTENENRILSKIVNNNNDEKNIDEKIASIQKQKSEFDKVILIESIINDQNISGKYFDIENIILYEEEPLVLKMLSKLLLSSLDNNIDVPSYLYNFLLDEKVSNHILNYLPEYLSPIEISSLYSMAKPLLNEEKKNLLMSYYFNNSFINGDDPFLDSYMKNEYENRKSNLSLNIAKTLSLAINIGENNEEYISMMKANTSIKDLLKEIPKQIDDKEFLIMWFKANLILSEDEYEKSNFIFYVENNLSDEEKTIINNFYGKKIVN